MAELCFVAVAWLSRQYITATSACHTCMCTNQGGACKSYSTSHYQPAARSCCGPSAGRFVRPTQRTCITHSCPLGLPRRVWLLGQALAPAATLSKQNQQLLLSKVWGICLNQEACPSREASEAHAGGARGNVVIRNACRQRQPWPRSILRRPPLHQRATRRSATRGHQTCAQAGNATPQALPSMAERRYTPPYSTRSKLLQQIKGKVCPPQPSATMTCHAIAVPQTDTQ